MSIVSGESTIGRTGLAMALTTRQGESLQLTLEAILRKPTYGEKLRLYG